MFSGGIEKQHRAVIGYMYVHKNQVNFDYDPHAVIKFLDL